MSGYNDIMLKELKDSITKLNTTIENQDRSICVLTKTLEESQRREAEKDQLITNLQAQLEYFKQKLFGSTSEKGAVKGIEGQLSIQDLYPVDEDVNEKPTATIEPECINVPAHTRSRKKTKATYDELFASLPRETIPVDTLTDEQKTCAECGTKMEPIGTEIIRTELRYTPPKLTRVDYVGTTWACPNCKDNEGDNEFVKDTTAPPALISGSYVSSGLAAHVMYAKYVLGLPLYRQEQDFKHLGVKISRTTMANWIITCAQEYLAPMYDYLHQKLLERAYLMADETPIQVLEEPDRRPQSKSYVWLVRTGEDEGVPIILYAYTPTRARYNIEKFLNGKQDKFYLMVDGYTGYNNLPNAVRCCCFAHLRRYFVKAIPAGHKDDFTEPAVQGVIYCDKLFAYERSYKEKGYSPKQIQKRRMKDQKPILEAFIKWIDAQKPQTGDRMVRALTYAKNCKPYMMNYLEDGCCSLSNNASENSVRPVVVGRKAWLFSKTQDGANASMQVFSMVETAKANGIDPKAYLEYLLEHRPNKNMTDEQLEALAPWSKETQASCKLKIE